MSKLSILNIKLENLYRWNFLCNSCSIKYWVLKYLPYSIVLPLTAMTYIWTMIIAKVAFLEKITCNKITGTILIIIGSVLIAL